MAYEKNQKDFHLSSVKIQMITKASEDFKYMEFESFMCSVCDQLIRPEFVSGGSYVVYFDDDSGSVVKSFGPLCDDCKRNNKF